MKRLPSKENIMMDMVAQRLFEEIVYSMDQYTNDSSISKFYCPEIILFHCQKTAKIFSQLIYSPIPPVKKIAKSHASGIFYLAMACGVQIFLKERILNKGYLSYKIKTDISYLREVRNNIGVILSEGIKVKPPVSQVMDFFIEELTHEQYLKRISLQNHEFNKDKFDNLLPAAIMWGYLFTKELIIDDKKNINFH